HDQRDLGIDCFADRVRGGGRRHVDDARVAIGLALGLGDRVEHREAEMHRAALAGRGASHHPRAVGDRLLGMEGAVAAGESLAQHGGVPVDQHRHQPASLTAATIFCAASSRSSAAMTLRPDSTMIFLPISTLVPSSRTTSGTLSPTSLTAAITPAAMMSQRMIPPKMLTRMPVTFGTAAMILNAALTRSLGTPTPTSMKFAGPPP